MCGWPPYLLNIMFRDLLDHHSSLTLSRTCEAPAVAEVHGLHALGKVQMGDVTCEIDIE